MGKLKNSPLVEAIFELRWGETQAGHFEYPNEELNFLPGIFSQSVKEQGFGFAEQLNESSDRPNISNFPYQVRHRFRKEAGKWPCFQIGLGIFTANQIGNLSLNASENDDYDWDDFKPAIITGLVSLDKSYPSGLNNLNSPQAILRYQDGFYLRDDETIESFVATKIKANIEIANVFTEQEHISNDAQDIHLVFAYQTTRPVGQITISVNSAQMNGRRSVMIETTVSSRIDEKNKSVDYLTNWCEKAHDLQRHAFDTLIKTSEL